MTNDYKEALEKAKDWLACSSCTDKERTLLKSIFKELNESPEDKIRRTLIEKLEISAQLRWQIQRIGLSPDDVISWLKNQGGSVNYDELTWKDINELEEIINNVHYEFRAGIGEESFGREVLERFLESKDIEAPKKSDRLMKALQTANAKIGELVEENYYLKNPEWSEEDEEMRLDAIKYLEIFDAQGIHGNKALPAINWLKSFSFPKGQSWSEEDENNRLLINKSIWEFVGENGITQGQAGGLIQWLKSLKFRFNWKPTEDQMSALDGVLPVNESDFSKEDFHLQSLYKDLEKL